MAFRASVTTLPWLRNTILVFRRGESFRRRPLLTVNLWGRLGNHMFQIASVMGLSQKFNMVPCYVRPSTTHTSIISDRFVNRSCFPTARHKEWEVGYGIHTTFSPSADGTLVVGSLQSFKYFDSIAPLVRSTLKVGEPVAIDKRFKGITNRTATAIVGIHVRRGDYLRLEQMRFPGAAYFLSAMAALRNVETHRRLLFVVVSDDVAWCHKQHCFQADDVRIVPGTGTPASDMSLLVSCDHMIQTIGTFGWWSAWLGAHAKGGRVIYPIDTIVMEHPVHQGKVRMEDHYPPEWWAMGEPGADNDAVSTRAQQSATFDSVGAVVPDVCPRRVTFGDGDGAKEACAVPTLRDPRCTVFSRLGYAIAEEWSFEHSVVQQTACAVHVYDCALPQSVVVPSELRARVTLHAQCVGAHDSNDGRL